MYSIWYLTVWDNTWVVFTSQIRNRKKNCCSVIKKSALNWVDVDWKYFAAPALSPMENMSSDGEGDISWPHIGLYSHNTGCCPISFLISISVGQMPSCLVFLLKFWPSILSSYSIFCWASHDLCVPATIPCIHNCCSIKKYWVIEVLPGSPLLPLSVSGPAFEEQLCLFTLYL